MTSAPTQPLGTRGLHAPLVLALAYLLGTYAVFLVLPLQLPALGPGTLDGIDYVKLTAFVLAAYACLAAGYRAGVARHRRRLAGAPRAYSPDRIARMRRLLVAGAMYYLVYGVAFIALYGGGLGAVFDAGEAYRRKFDRLAQLEEGAGGAAPIIQLLTLAYGLSYLTVPLAVLLWDRLSGRLRSLVVAAVVAFALSYLAVGTQKGLGDLVIYTGAAWMVRHFAAGRARPGGRPRPARLAVPVAALLLFVAYMGYGLVARMDAYGARAAAAYGLRGTWLADALGEETALGVASVLGYPSHGYAGLGLDLELPFEWTRGLGSSRALGDYARQYLDLELDDQTYLARGERAHGWPAGMYWSTVFPWLASDLTFPGCLAAMYAVGRLWSRCWIESLARGPTSSLILFTQLCLFVAYVPANNQLLQNRFSLWGTAALAIWWIAEHRALPRRPYRVGPGGARH